MQALLTVDQLSTYLCKSAASIRCDASRNPQSLPPICRLPGTKRLLWRMEDVEKWLAEHVVVIDSAAISTTPEQRKRGRPTKAEQVAQRRRAGK
ncbi:hypothetical protein FQZ97_596310 [compost metagenome]